MIEQDRRCGKHLQERILLVTYLSMSKLMGFWSLLGQSKFGLDTFGNVNHEGVDTELVTVAHYKCPVERVYKGVTYVKLQIISPFIGTNGEKEYKILKFSAYYETAKFVGNQSDQLGKLKQGEILNRITNFAYGKERHKLFGFCRRRTCACVTPNLGPINDNCITRS